MPGHAVIPSPEILEPEASRFDVILGRVCMKNVISIAFVAVLLSGCASTTGIVEVEDNHYMLSTQDYMAYSGSEVKVAMFKEARAYCNAKGKKMVVIGQQSQDMAYYTSFASAEIRFKCE